LLISLSPFEALRGSDYDIELMNSDPASIQDSHSLTILGEVYNPTYNPYTLFRMSGFSLLLVSDPNENANDDEMSIL